MKRHRIKFKNLTHLNLNEYQKQEPRSKLIGDDTRLHDQTQVK